MFIDFTKEMMKRNFAEDGVPNIDEFITWLKPNEDDDFETMACKSFLVLFKEVLQANIKIKELEMKLAEL